MWMRRSLRGQSMYIKTNASLNNRKAIVTKISKDWQLKDGCKKPSAEGGTRHDTVDLTFRMGKSAGAV